MEVINMTPHDIHIFGMDNQIVKTYPASGNEIRLTTTVEFTGSLPDGTPLTRTWVGKPVGLPESQKGTTYIVSQMVKSALPDRHDLLVPVELVRGTSGIVIGCRSLGI
jgi:hypothetical protein